MFKFALIVFSIFIVQMGGAAHANQINVKWTQLRQAANALGDAAKDGDKAAYTTLSELANQDANGPAMHNMGWLLDVGFYVGKDKKAACDWYKKASTLTQYPPSMHNYALCLFRGTNGEKSSDDEALGRELMYDAYMRGWTKSAIILSEKILNTPLLSHEDAFQAFSISKSALRTTRPTPDEFSSLQYLVGMAAILGPRDMDQYREGYAAMLLAISSGHPRAEKEMIKLEYLWMAKVVAAIDKLEAYDDSTAQEWVERCYGHLADKSTDMHIVNFCKDVSEKELNKVTYLSEDANYLSSMIMSDDGEIIRSAQQRLEAKAGPYRRAKLKWEIIFIPKYETRVEQEADKP